MGGIKRNSSFLVALSHLLLIFCNITDTNHHHHVDITWYQPGAAEGQCGLQNDGSRWFHPGAGGKICSTCSVERCWECSRQTLEQRDVRKKNPHILKSYVQQTDSLSSLQKHLFYLFIGTFPAASLVLLILENCSHKKSHPALTWSQVFSA